MQLNDQSLFRQQAFCNGEWIDAQSDQVFPIYNPYDQSLLAEVPDMNAQDTQVAIEAAAQALPAWRSKSAGGRAKLLKKWYQLIRKNVDDLALLLTSEQGKPLLEAKGEILYGASYVEWFAEEARRAYGDVIPGHGRSMRILTIKQPIGVVGAITPWNFPNAMITRKIAPALAAGCTVVLKPAEATPLSALALAELAQRAGFPPGVINIVTSNQAAEVGEELCRNPIVRKLSFTGSTRVGKILMRQCADTIKKLSLELGGNAPFIVFDDADLDAAVAGAIGAKYRNAGQTCICANRIYVQAGIYDDFVAAFQKAVGQLEMGNGLDEDVVIGPLINQAALDKVERLVKEALAGGAAVLTGGEAATGYFYPPTVLVDAKPDMAIHREEIFGPVAPVYRFQEEVEVIELANATEYGLACYFYGRDYARIWRVAEALEYGMVGINTPAISTAAAPFGGVKESGIGREGSKYGLEEFMEIKYMCFGGVS